MLSSEDYIKQLQVFSDNPVEIEEVWKEAISLNHSNAIGRFAEIADNWLDKPLDKEAKNELCDRLCVMRAGGKKAGWTKVKELLIEGGYKVDDKRTSKARYTIITR